MSAELVLRALAIKQLNGFSYEELAFHLADSTCYRAFCRLGSPADAPSKSALQENIKRVSAEALESVGQAVLRIAQRSGIESGQKVRMDCTATETTIHAPSDSTLLWDVNRVLVRLMKQSAEEFGIRFTNHERRAKRRMYNIQYAKKRSQRVRRYRDLVRVTECTLGDADRVAAELMGGAGFAVSSPILAIGLAEALKQYATLGRQVVDQTRRRVFHGESVPAEEKILSIFEPHTDIIKTGGDDPTYGHKLCLSLGATGLVLDCVVERGNPADKTLATKMVERHRRLYDAVPRQIAFDGGFASKKNLSELKAMGIEDVSFNKRCGLAITEMVRSSWVYRQLRNFRAGIEGLISFLKRCFGLTRCTWRGYASFTAYVWASVLSANLLTIARHRLAAAKIE
jgi:IS5 family transposase